MAISEKGIRSLNALGGALFLEYPKDSPNPELNRGRMWRVKPSDIEEGLEGVHLFGKYHWLYHQAIHSLKQELSLEFMSDRDLDDALWHLTCEIILQRSSFSDWGAVKNRIKEFASQIAQPIINFEILIPLLNIDVGEKNIQIGNSFLRKFDETTLNEWGITKETGSPHTYDRFLNKSCYLIEEKGNNQHLVCNRAREKAYFLTKLLQVSLDASRVYRPYQLLYSLGTEVAIRLKDSPENVGFDWVRGFSPIPPEIDDKLEADINSFLRKTRSTLFTNELDPDLRKSFRNAITWFGRSIEEEDLDTRIVFLSTALESILTTISDKEKGETIAYRMLLLNTYLEDSYVHPSRVLYIYELRSKIIHGSELAVSTKDDYATMRHVTRETIENAILAIGKMGVTRKKEFHTQLESKRTAVDQILFWLNEQADARSKIIADHMKSRLS